MTDEAKNGIRGEVRVLLHFANITTEDGFVLEEAESVPWSNDKW